MAYTAGSLLGYMETEVGPQLAALGLDASDALSEGVAEVVALLGAEIADVDDDLKLRTLARWQAWLAAYNAATAQYDLKAGSSSLTRSQVFEQIERRLARAEASALRYDEVAAALGGGTAYVSSVATAGSPYAWSEWG